MNSRFYREFWENLSGAFCAFLGVAIGVAIFCLERQGQAAVVAIKPVNLSDVGGEVVPAQVSNQVFSHDEVGELLVDGLYIIDGKELEEMLVSIQTQKEAKVKREAEAKAKREAAAKAKREAAAKAKREAEAKAKREAEAKAKREAAAKAKREAAAKAKREAAAKAKREAAAKAKREAEAKAKREAEAKAKREAEAKVKREAEAKAKREAAAKVKREAEAKLGKLESPSLSEMTSLSGRGGEAVDGAIAWFVSALQNKMNPHWSLPPNIMVAGLDAQLFVRVDADGQVLKVDLLRSSGYELFDNGAIQAVWKSSPLPMPTNPKAVKKLVDEGIIGNFKP